MRRWHRGRASAHSLPPERGPAWFRAEAANPRRAQCSCRDPFEALDADSLGSYSRATPDAQSICITLTAAKQSGGCVMGQHNNGLTGLLILLLISYATGARASCEDLAKFPLTD